ncbi:protein FAM8A1-like [Saccoglossus kowalevskii]|uniref:Protein FAM8A1-like n=1 Tax=Saccoglossus kowalevskii TaxID=10224 RepID=A0ABM0MK24_SACKO|nr:PREDICTED: protein FAM8A1-like [Saccoglossus kowalevskii]
MAASRGEVYQRQRQRNPLTDANDDNIRQKQKAVEKLLGMEIKPTRICEKTSTGSGEIRPSSREYTEAVSRWISEYRMFQGMCFNISLLNPMTFQSPIPPATGFGIPSNAQNGFVPSFGQNNVQFPGQQQTPSTPHPFHQRQETTQTQELQWKEYQVPSIYRRIAAEFIDFIILFTVKVLLTLFLMDYTDAIGDQTDFTMKFLLEELDEEATIDDLQQMLVMATVYRLSVCVYETIFLTRGVRYFGGATPGKYLMGLRVISSDRVVNLGSEKVLVFNGKDIGMLSALVRSLIKNFSMAFFFPVYMTILFYHHNRGVYDIIAGTMVVTGPKYRRQN